MLVCALEISMLCAYISVVHHVCMSCMFMVALLCVTRCVCVCVCVSEVGHRVMN